MKSGRKVKILLIANFWAMPTKNLQVRENQILNIQISALAS